jgi:type I restriction enzyme, S subunit
MGEFEFNKKINPNKIFLIQHSELEARIDPHQYHHERIAAIKAIKRKNKTVHLTQLVMSVKLITKEISPDNIYIGLENITSNTGEYVATAEKQSISTAGVFKKGEILFPKLRPYLNKVYLAEFDGICSTEFHIFQAKNISPEFLAIYLRSDLIVNQTKHLMTGNTLPRLQTDDIQKLPVPLVSDVIQSKVIEFYKKVDKQKQEKEQQAQALLDSIDTYLLNELGITLPEQDRVLEKRMFTVPLSEATGQRLDSRFYKTEFQKLIEAISSGKHFKLKDVAEFSSEVWNQSDYFIETFPYIEISEIELSTGEIVNVKHVPIDEAPSRAKMIVRQGDIIISLTRPTRGAIAHNQLPGINIASNGFAVIRTLKNEIVSKELLFLLLKMSSTLRQMEQRATGGSYPAITQEELGNILLPCTEISHQKKIVAHVTQIRSQAKQLQTEAAQILNKAKAEIERMILGEV